MDCNTYYCFVHPQYDLSDYLRSQHLHNLLGSSYNSLTLTVQCGQLSTDQSYYNCTTCLASSPTKSLILVAEFVQPSTHITASFFLCDLFGHLPTDQSHRNCRIYLATSSQNIFIAADEDCQMSTEQSHCTCRICLASQPENRLIVLAEFVLQASQRTGLLYLHNLFVKLAGEHAHCTCRICLARQPENSLIVPAEFVWQASQITVSLFLQNLFGQLSEQQYRFD